MTSVTSQGQVIGQRYRLVGRLGRGGMAEVWEAQDDVLRRRVAVKLFHLGGDADDARRAAVEMHTLAGLSHPNLVTVHDAGTDGDRMFLVMELVAGPTLAERISATGGLDPTEVAALGAHLATGLGYIHQRGIVHRDVKPANVLLPERDHADSVVAKLADFGIAQTAGQDRLTKTGMTIGTARYLAPEQVTGRPVGPPADIYALGLVLLEASGSPPSWTGTPIEIAMARLSTSPVVPADLGPGWAPLLTAMTSRDPADRPTAAQVRAAIGAMSTTAVSTAPRHDGATLAAPAPGSTALLTDLAPGPPERSRRRLLLGAAAVVAAAAVVVSIVLTLGTSGPSAPVDDGPARSAVADTPAPGTSTPAGLTPSASAVAQTSVAGPTPVTPTQAASAPTPVGHGGPPGKPGHTPPGQTKGKGKG